MVILTLEKIMKPVLGGQNISFHLVLIYATLEKVALILQFDLMQRSLQLILRSALENYNSY